MAGEHLKRITTRAKAIRKANPKLEWKHAIRRAAAELRSGEKKVVKAVKKVVSGTKKKTVKVTIRKAKGGNLRMQISGVALDKMRSEHTHLASLEKVLHYHQQLLKSPGLKAGEKVPIRRDIVKAKHAIAASKKHIQSLKKSI